MDDYGNEIAPWLPTASVPSWYLSNRPYGGEDWVHWGWPTMWTYEV